MQSNAVLLSLALLGIALSGCVSDDSPAAAPADAGPDAAPAEVDDDTGGIEGSVVNEEGLPLAGAAVSLAELELQSITDKTGKFSFSKIAPGGYNLFVAKLGYESRGLRVDVSFNQVTMVEVTLPVLPVVEARQQTVIWNGFMKCSMGIWNVGWSEECGEGVGTPVGTFGKDPNNKVDYDFDLLERPETMLTETSWVPNTAAANGMRVILVENLVCDPFCGWDKNWADKRGGSPVRLIADGFPADAGKYPLALTVRHWADLGTGATDPIRLITDQRFEVYKTEFFGAEIPNDEWTALPPS